jgi:hypothetical protein
MEMHCGRCSYVHEHCAEGSVIADCMLINRLNTSLSIDTGYGGEDQGLIPVRLGQALFT